MTGAHRFEVPKDPFSNDCHSFCHCGLIGEIIQSELALWTFAFSTLLAHIWTSKKRYFLFNLTVVVPLTICITVILSWILLAFITVGRLFSCRDSQNSAENDDSGDYEKLRSWQVEITDPVPETRKRKRSKRQYDSSSNLTPNGHFKIGTNSGSSKNMGRQGKNVVEVGERTPTTSTAYFWQRRGSLERKIIAWFDESRVRSKA